MTSTRSNKKKILIKASSSLSTSAHGAEAHTILSFVDFLSDDYLVKVVGPEIYPEELVPFLLKPMLRYERVLGKFSFILHVPIAVINTVAACKFYKPDLMICVGGVFYNGLAITIASWLFKRPCLVRTAEDHYETAKLQATFLRNVYHRILVLPLTKYVLSHTTWVMTVGVASKGYFISKGISRNRIFAAPNPLALKNFPVLEGVSKTELRHRFGFKDSKKIALFIGGGEPMKGADFLPEIISSVVKKSDDWHFAVVGAMSTASKELQLELEAIDDRWVTLLPALPYSKLNELYRSVDVLIFLARIGVGYGLVTVEAGICGCPVLCLNPKLDVAELHGDSPRDIENLVEKLISEDFNFPDLSRFTNMELNRQRHLEIIHQCIQSEVAGQ